MSSLCALLHLVADSTNIRNLQATYQIRSDQIRSRGLRRISQSNKHETRASASEIRPAQPHRSHIHCTLCWVCSCHRGTWQLL